MKIIQAFITLTLFACIIYMFLNQYNNTSKIHSDDTITVGIAAGYAPFISINQFGDYEGFDIDVIKQTAQVMNKKLILKDLGSMTSLLMALSQGSIDMIIWGMSITPERLTKSAMVHYQGAKITSYPLIFWQEIPEHIKSLDDLNGLVVCVEPTSAQDAVLSAYPNITALPTEKVDDALLNIQYKKAIAALVDPTIAKKFQTKYPEIKILEIPLAPQYQVDGNGIMMNKKNKELIEQVTTAIEQLKTSGFITKAENKWGLA